MLLNAEIIAFVRDQIQKQEPHMTTEWDEKVRKVQDSLDQVLRVGDTYVDQFESLMERHLEAQKRIHKLLYWLDMDRETFERMSEQEQADHLHILEEVQGIKDALLGKEKANDREPRASIRAVPEL